MLGEKKKKGRPSERELYARIRQRDAEIEEWKKRYEDVLQQNKKLHAIILNRAINEVKILPRTNIITSE